MTCPFDLPKQFAEVIAECLIGIQGLSDDGSQVAAWTHRTR